MGGNRKRSDRKEQEDDEYRNMRMRWAGTGRYQIERSRKMSGYKHKDEVGGTGRDQIERSRKMSGYEHKDEVGGNRKISDRKE